MATYEDYLAACQSVCEAEESERAARKHRGVIRGRLTKAMRKAEREQEIQGYYNETPVNKLRDAEADANDAVIDAVQAVDAAKHAARAAAQTTYLED